MSDRISTVKIVIGDNITEGLTNGKVVSQFPAGNNCINLSALRGDLTNTVKVGIRADKYPCFLCKVFIEGPQKDCFELSYDGITWISSPKYLFFQFIATVNQMFYVRSQTLDTEELKDYIDNYLNIQFQAPIGSSGSAS